jgi:antitoxin component of MazEF toxin-antitoxin module
MSKTRFDTIKKHGNSACVPITKELEELGWKEGDNIKITAEKKQLVISLVGEVA